MMEPRGLTHGPADSDPCVCAQCGSDDILYRSDTYSYCYQCEDDRSVVKESEFDYASQEKRDRENLEQQRRLMG